MSRGLDPVQVFLKLTESERQNALMALATLAEKRSALERKLLTTKVCSQQLLQQRNAALKCGVYATKLATYDLALDEKRILLENLNRLIHSLDQEEQQLLTSFMQTDRKKNGLEKIHIRNLKKEERKTERLIRQGMDDMMARRAMGHR